MFNMIKRDTKLSIEWSEWSTCSAKCGLGQQIRTIICLDFDSNSTCDPNKIVVRNCFINICDNNKTWSELSDWIQCSSSSKLELNNIFFVIIQLMVIKLDLENV